MWGAWFYFFSILVSQPSKTQSTSPNILKCFYQALLAHHNTNASTKRNSPAPIKTQNAFGR